MILESVKQVKLQLTFANIVSFLVHVAELQADIVGQTVAERNICPVPIKIIDFPAVSDAAFQVYEQFVIQGQVHRTCSQVVLVKRVIQRDEVARPITKILIVYVALLEAKAMG